MSRTSELNFLGVSTFLVSDICLETRGPWGNKIEQGAKGARGNRSMRQEGQSSPKFILFPDLALGNLKLQRPKGDRPRESHGLNTIKELCKISI
jgi:hypothetical protein